MIRCVVFDFDGTLVDSNYIKRSAFFEVANSCAEGGAVMGRILMEALGRDRYWVFDKFASAMPGCLVAAELVASYTRICRERIAQAPEIGGASACLEQLCNDGVRLFLSSATPHGPLLEVVGDGESDRSSAQFMGCHFVAVESDGNDFAVEPLYRVSDLTRLPSLLSHLN